MKSLLVSAFILSSGLILVSCNQSKHLTDEQMQKIVHDRNSALEKAFLDQDTSQLSKVYASDARLSPNGDDFYVGRDAILKFWADDFSSSKLTNMTTTTLSVEGGEDVIYETGIARTETAYQDSIYHGVVKFINVWKRQPDGSYQLAIDFWNSPKQD